jgi:hypothetical protein
MSDIARFRRQQALEEQSARLALHGPAMTASHDAIIARMQQGAATLLHLFETGRDAEAYVLWNAGILEGNTEVQAYG